MSDSPPKKAKRNRTIQISSDEIEHYGKKLLTLENHVSADEIINTTINQDIFTCLDFFPAEFIDLMIIDPPYNLDKRFNKSNFSKMPLNDYQQWVDRWFPRLIRLLKPTASLYICADPFSSTAIYTVVAKYLKIRNRITWEREKGRGALSNWKSCAEDIWFCTMSNKYTFNVDAVKLKRKVIAPYTTTQGKPKDWNKTSEGNFRLTHPSNMWTDITIPFWSMPENVDHPTQKPEKLLAKIILASSNKGDVIFDPFLGSGTSSVVAKKLKRNFVGVELDKTYACISEKRLAWAENDLSIQGYYDGVFWERNSLKHSNKP